MICWKSIGELTDEVVLGTGGKSTKEPTKKVRAILIRTDDKYAVTYEKSSNSYALPGGSIDPGEDQISALIREVFEETGCSCDVISPLGIIHENRSRADTTRSTYYFVVHTSTKQSALHLTEEEIKLGTSLLWCSLEDLLRLIKDSPATTDAEKFRKERDLLALSEYMRVNQEP